MDIKVIYEESGENSYLIPVWMIIEHFILEWDKTFYIDMNLPFERLPYELIDIEKSALSVPNHAYVLHKTDPLKIGIHLPTLKDYLNSMNLETALIDIEQLVIRINDVEEVLQYLIKMTV